jgi:hypothetical protein
MITRFAAALREHAGGAILFEVTQQAKHLAPAQADQRTRILNPQST